MTAAEIRTAVEQVLGTVPFTAPVSVMYTCAVRDALRVLVGDMPIDVFHRLTSLHVIVVRGRERHEFSYNL